ncbi:hypothetical protein ACQ86B_13655 [Mycolicibacterium aichiense]|uniref:hypothetical protein n=1 Tax=Mycolicibacterium aichiense TaxID=1799 RepID=UPI003D66AD39
MTSQTNRTGALAMIAALAMTTVTGCGLMKSDADKVSNPLTPEQSEDQVIDAAHETVATLGLQVTNASVWHASCNDQGDPPFRGQLRLSYPPPAAGAGNPIDQIVQKLKAQGWTDAQDFATHGTALEKNNIVAVFAPGNAINANYSIEFFGECRDITTTKDTKGRVEPITLT